MRHAENLQARHPLSSRGVESSAMTFVSLNWETFALSHRALLPYLSFLTTWMDTLGRGRYNLSPVYSTFIGLDGFIRISDEESDADEQSISSIKKQILNCR